MTAIVFILGVVIGLMVGGMVVYIHDQPDSIGDIRVDVSDPEGPYLFLESRIPIEELMKRTDVRMRVRITKCTSH